MATQAVLFGEVRHTSVINCRDCGDSDSIYETMKRKACKSETTRHTSKEVYGNLAQLVEHRTFNPVVVGSSPVIPTILPRRWFIRLNPLPPTGGQEITIQEDMKMKNIIEILSELGITVPEDKHAALNKGVAENYKTIAEHEKKVNRLTDDLNAATKRAETAEETLKGFAGKDFDAITRDRDEWQRKHNELVETHKKETEEREFNDDLSAAITEAKGKNAKAIMALLDLDKLRGSKNRDKDIKTALDSLRTESGYLFEDNGGDPKFTDPKGNGGNGNPNALTVENIRAIKDPTERQAKIKQFMQMKKGSNN